MALEYNARKTEHNGVKNSKRPRVPCLKPP